MTQGLSTSDSLVTGLPADEAGHCYQVVEAHPNLVASGGRELDLDWQGRHWRDVPVMTINQFLEESSSHRPLTELKLQHSPLGIYGLFRAEDRYVQCTQTQFQDRVCRDACVEVYFMPQPERDRGSYPHAPYINLEISGNGTLLSYLIRDAQRTEDGFADYVPLSAEHGEQIRIESTLPGYVFPEVQSPMEWYLAFFLPYSVMEAYLPGFQNPEGGAKGQTWRGNGFKCTEDSSHPHWSSWQPCSAFNFHEPQDFGELRFI